MKKISYPKYFWIVLLIAIAVDTSFDFIAFKQTHLADATGEVVVKTYELLEEFTLVGQGVRENLGARVTHDQVRLDESLRAIKTHFERSLELSKNRPDQNHHLQSLSFLRVLPDDGSKISQRQLETIAQTVFGARRAEETELKSRLARDEEQSRIAQKQVFIASGVDIALLLLAGFLWILESRARRKNETVLTEAIHALNVSNFELQAVVAAKSKQIRSTVHDLKNPLGSINGFAELLVDDFDKPSSVLEMSNVIQRISKHTLELVSSLVESETRQKKLSASFETLNLNTYLKEVCTSLKPQIAKKHQTLSFDCPIAAYDINGNRQKIWDLFMNLIGNAVKFSPVGGKIEVRLASFNGRIRVEIEDDGPGFSQQDQLEAFKEFKKLSAKPTGGEHSSGLGLNLAKAAAEFHNGRLEISKRPGSHSGAMLIVELPARRDETWS